MEQADPSKPSLPVSFPIKDLESLASRSFTKSFHYPYIEASVPLSGSGAAGLPPRRRLLVCHDMAGGYGDDKWVQGGSNPNAYAIWHWHLMDVFVYFSHNLVTLPPPCWINAAHTHGVKVLGTFITEWDEGREICRSLLASKESARMYAERLVDIAASLGFEGWLINMEVEIDIVQIPILLEFLGHLTRTMHAAVPGSLIIWYDSVTKDGKLHWQDELNVNNQPFFDLCDGIFVNYSWTENSPKISADFAGDRKLDVYMGIDVFGRNTYGGGQWDTKVALDLLKKDDVSAAVFAPGWVYETIQGPDFQTAQNRWWGLVETSWGALRSYPNSLPFYSNFDQGHGNHFSIDGLQVADEPWNNISCQTVQPALDPFMDSVEPPIKVQLDFNEKSYSGGSNLSFNGALDSKEMFKTRLFLVELPLGDEPLRVSYSVRTDDRSVIGLALSLSSKSRKGEEALVLVIEGGPSYLPVDFLRQFDRVVDPSRLPRSSESWTLLEALIHVPDHILTEVNAICCVKPEVTRAIVTPSFRAALGHVAIIDLDSPQSIPSLSVTCKNISWVSSSGDEMKTVNAEILWDVTEGGGADFTPMWCNVFVRWLGGGEDGGSEGKERFLGLTRMGRFYVADLGVPAGVVGVRFIVQVCSRDGACSKLDRSPWIDLCVAGY